MTSHDDTCNLHSSLKYHSFFCLIVKLTDEGLEKVDLVSEMCPINDLSNYLILISILNLVFVAVAKVVQLINYYIGLMVRTGPQENHFNEERLISLTNIRFEDEISPLKNVVELAKQLFIYPLEYAIIGPKLLYEFNGDVVKYCLDFIKIQPRISIILSKKAFRASNWPTNKDYWSDIEWKVEPLPEQWSQPIIETEELVNNLKMPPSNEYIASNFELKSHEGCFHEHPVLIDEDSHYKCFFKNDKTFRKPKACIYLVYQSDFILQSPEAIVSLELYFKYFLLTIIEYAYPAEIAGLKYTIQVSNGGVELKVSGYNHKLFKLLKLIQDELTKFSVDGNLFDTIKLDCIREHYNLLISNEDLVDNVMNRLLLKYNQTYAEQRELIKKLDIQAVRDQVINFFATAYCQCLIQGNYTKREAQEIFEYVKSTSLSIKEEVNLEEIKKSFIHKLPAGKHYCYIRSFNKIDENILINNKYQLGKLNDEEIVMLDLVMQEMGDPLFNLLRNEQTLAYYLYCRYSRSTTDICSYQIVVKSLADKFTPQHVDEQIEWFVNHFLDENILKMTEQHFKELVEARIKRKQVPFVKLTKEADYNWKEICNFTYRFNRLNEEIEILKKVSLRLYSLIIKFREKEPTISKHFRYIEITDQTQSTKYKILFLPCLYKFQLQLDRFVKFATNILRRGDEMKKLSVVSIGTGNKTKELFACDSNSTIDNGEDGDEFNNNDNIVYSLVYMKPKQIESDCNLIDNVDKFVDERVCF